MNMLTQFSQPLSVLAFSLFINLISSFILTANASLSSNSIHSVFVTPEWAHQNQQALLFIDLSSQASYQKFHIENALWMNYDWLIKPQNGLALSGGTAYMSRVLSQLGITPETHIVLYDDMGNLNASRLYWELKKLNHRQISILDGGTVAWVLKGFKVTQSPPLRPTKTIYPEPTSHLTNVLTADKMDVREAIKNPSILLIDTRSFEEYVGDSKQKRSGHIPNAVFFEWSLAIDMKNGFRQIESTTLLAYLKTLGIEDKNQPIITYCHTGHRAARLISMLDSLGFTHVKLYDGSMQEYAIDNSLPLRVGDKP